MEAGVPQGSVLGPTLYTLYTMDIPQQSDVTTSLFADDTAIVARHKDYEVAVSQLWTAVSAITSWAQTWKILLNKIKSIRVD